MEPPVHSEYGLCQYFQGAAAQQGGGCRRRRGGGGGGRAGGGAAAGGRGPAQAEPQQQGRPELQQVRHKLQQHRMPTPAAVAAVGVEVAVAARGRGGAASEPWIPFLPWSAAVYNYHSKNESKYDPEGYCLPPGGPRLYATPYPMVILQQPELKRIYMNFEGGTHVWREIFMDGRPHPAKDKLQGATWLGHSVGRWEGDTLVVDVTNFNEGTWLDYFRSSPHRSNARRGTMDAAQ